MLFKKQKTNYYFLAVLFLAAVFIWLVIFEQTESNLLEVHFFDVGQGDAIFIETSAGRQVLIDGGPDAAILEKLNQTMPFYDRSIDLVILTHPEADHLTGLVKVLDYYQIGHILTSGIKKETAVFQRWQELVREKNIPLTKAQAGQLVILESSPQNKSSPEQRGVVLKILWPEQSLIDSLSSQANNVSVVAQLVYGQSEFLLAGDIERKIEGRLLNQKWNLESDVLKVAHHGSKTSTSQNFLEAVNPRFSVISVGAANQYGHPHSIVLERLNKTAIYQTAKSGDIEILTDGSLFQVKTEK